MRLLMTADALGGVWTYAVELAHGLAPFGIETTLAVLGPPPGADQAAQAREIPRLTLRETDLPLDWLAGGPGDVLRAGDSVAALARAIDADLVHLNTPALAAGNAFDRPVVVACHSCVLTWWQALHAEPLPPALAWQADLAARGYAVADACVAPSGSFAETTRTAYRLAHPPAVVANGRRPALLPPRPSRDVVFTAGRLWDRGKNLAALDRVAQDLPWPVVAAGATHGPDGSQAVLPHIRTLGRLRSEAVAQWLAARPVFASLARYEPFGLAVLEAAQAGCAMILSDIPVFRELWEECAVFVPPDDTDAAADAIRGVMRDPGERDRLGRCAAARAARYTAAAMAAGMAALYRPIVRLPATAGAA